MAYYCCYSILFGCKPKQCAHIEHETFKHDLDARIIRRPDDEDGLVDEFEAYATALKRLAGYSRYWFTDQESELDWIAVPWYWKHNNATNSFYSHFTFCFSEKYLSLKLNLAKAPLDETNNEALAELKAWLLAKKSDLFI